MAPRLTPEQFETIERLWPEPLSINEIARQAGCRPDTVASNARKHGWKAKEMRPGKPADSRWTPENIELCKLLYITRGLSATETAEAMGIDYTRRMIVGLAFRQGWNKAAMMPTRLRVSNRYKERKPPKPSVEKRVRLVAPKPHIKPVAPAIRARPWQPLEGSSPVDLFSRCGCKWPVDGGTSQLFCNLPIHNNDRNGWCETHIGMGRMADRPRSSARDLERLIRRAL